MDNRIMVTFSSGPNRFPYRVGAIVIRGEHVLLMRNLSEDYWFVPGGRVELLGRIKEGELWVSATSITRGQSFRGEF